jgi:hypothetical protein
VANDFGPTIRLGQGEEVRDVPHPLSTAGLASYQFRIRDTLRISAGTDTLKVVAVDTRPVDPAAPGLIGIIYLDVERAALVRLQFTFTGASYRDPTVERISVLLENALEERQRWLPFRQSIVIDRSSAWVALPISSRIRADWEIVDYRLGVVHPPGRFSGAAVDGLSSTGGDGWERPIAVAPESGDAFAVELASLAWLLGGARIDGLPRLRLAGSRGVSSFAHVNRVEGVALGGGLRWTPRGNVQLSADASWATSAERFSGGASFRVTSGGSVWRVEGSRRVVDVLDDLPGSVLINSIATVLWSGDTRDWLLRDRIGVGVEMTLRGALFDLGIARETTSPLAALFSGLDGASRTNPVLGNGPATVTNLSIRGIIGRAVTPRLRLEHGAGPRSWTRADLRLRSATAGMDAALELGVGSGSLPAHRAFVLGGRESLVGHLPMAYWGRRMMRLQISRPIELSTPVPRVPGVPSGGRLPSSLSPVVTVAAVGGEIPLAPGRHSDAIEASIGLRLDLWGPLVRLTLGWDPRRGNVGFVFDAHPDWWPML